MRGMNSIAKAETPFDRQCLQPVPRSERIDHAGEDRAGLHRLQFFLGGPSNLEDDIRLGDGVGRVLNDLRPRVLVELVRHVRPLPSPRLKKDASAEILEFLCCFRG